ncbi:MAG TPA: hypothetical protein VLI94_05670 [Solirubrobacterales bacterium]|nr:hypothetical protein [Solirubrobacterales bacterium]
MKPVTSRLLTILAIAIVALAAFAGSASAAFSVTPTRTLGMGSLFDVAPDGTFWSVSGSGGMTFVHTDDEGNNLGDGFSVNYPNYIPLGIGYYDNRVYMTGSITFGSRLISYQAVSSDPGHDLVESDNETDERIGGNQAMLRMFDDGGIALALGQENKIGVLSGKDLTTEHPYYPQGFHGAGINKNFTVPPPFALESCVVGIQSGPVGGNRTIAGRKTVAPESKLRTASTTPTTSHPASAATTSPRGSATGSATTTPRPTRVPLSICGSAAGPGAPPASSTNRSRSCASRAPATSSSAREGTGGSRSSMPAAATSPRSATESSREPTRWRSAG